MHLQAHRKQGFKWWVQRLSRAFQLYDETRIDHFRGFAGGAASLPHTHRSASHAKLLALTWGSACCSASCNQHGSLCSPTACHACTDALRVGYYAVDAKAETAIDGDWRKGPGKELFDALEKVRPC